LYAHVLPFILTSVNANHGGNTGNITVEITGSKFSSDMQVILHPVSGGSEIVAGALNLANASRGFATFNLLNKAIGTNDVILRKPDNSTTMLSAAFLIEAGNSGGFYIGGISNTGQSGTPDQPGCNPGANAGINQQLSVNVDLPARALLNRGFSIKIFYGNASNVDIPVPTRFLISQDANAISLTPSGLTDNKMDLYLEFRELNGPQNVLRPGANGVITIYCKIMSGNGHTYKHFTLQ